MKKSTRWITRITFSIIFLLAVAITVAFFTLRASLPQTEGNLNLEGLVSSVTINRDAQGIPFIKSNNRLDIAYALGFIHAQERFFQMDLLRRNSAGELSELFGGLAVKHDSAIRTHQFRKRAERALAAQSQKDRDILNRYSQGVNNGLRQLDSRPFEYWLLQQVPKEWQPSDSLLTVLSMYLDLQPEWNKSERSRAEMQALLPADWMAFLDPLGGKWDSPNQGSAYDEELQIPEKPLASFTNHLSVIQSYQTNQQQGYAQQESHYRDRIHLGSNNWSVSGKLSPYDSGMLANDMHLGIRVPNIWYRASWTVPGAQRNITGATLPGTPVMVVGSNEHIAWGFTNSEGDYHDSIILQTNDKQTAYLTPDGWHDFKTEIEIIKIKAQKDKTIQIKTTHWGPVIGTAPNGQPMAMRWVAHDVQGLNLASLEFETTDTVEQALPIAAVSGIPGQNFNVVDRQGNQGWTIMGRLPKRVGFDGKTPQDWSDGEKYWDGYLDYTEYPKVVNPESGRIWTANARVADGEQLVTLGWGRYALGARQQQIRNDLLAKDKFDEQDFLDIQLDNKAVFLSRWQQLLLSTLNSSDNPALKRLLPLVKNWGEHASIDSVGYLAVKRFRETVIDKSLGELNRWLKENQKGDGFYRWSINNYVEYSAWALVSQRPERHLPAGSANWPEFLEAQALTTYNKMTADGNPIEQATWGKTNTLAIVHPLSGSIPLLGEYLNMPRVAVPGDTRMPLVQSPRFGASERFAVAPGHEDRGYFHMATGQSAHPLSPYFDKGHQHWLEGKPSPFLPGKTEWILELKPH